MQAGAAVQFAADVQRALRRLRWEDFEGDVQGMWRVPRVSFCPCVRTAVDVAGDSGPVLLSRASGRAFPAGPHVRRLLQVGLTAAPAEVVVTEAALDTWHQETMVRGRACCIEGGGGVQCRTTSSLFVLAWLSCVRSCRALL